MVAKFCNDSSYRGDYQRYFDNPEERSKYVWIAAEEKGWIHKAVDRSSYLRRLFATVSLICLRLIFTFYLPDSMFPERFTRYEIIIGPFLLRIQGSTS